MIKKYTRDDTSNIKPNNYPKGYQFTFDDLINSILLTPNKEVTND